MADDADFLGTGWSFPPSFLNGGVDIGMVAGVEDIHQSLQIILATQPGERIMQDQFGCDMHNFVFAELDQGMINTVRQIVHDAILYHEPRVNLEGLHVAEDRNEPGLLMISIEYSIRGTNSRYNMVYPFYINEASAPLS